MISERPGSGGDAGTTCAGPPEGACRYPLDITTHRSLLGFLVGVAFIAIGVGGCGGSGLPVGNPVATTTTTTTTTTTSVPVDSVPPSASATGTESPDQSASAPRVSWQGGDGFLLGANLPWYNWGCDFGCGLGARDGEGVSSPAVLETVATAIERAADARMNVVRWWTFPGEPWQIRTDADGLPSGIDEAVDADFEAALALADLLEVSYVFTIFSAPSEIPGPWLTTEEGRSRLADVLGELFARYGDHPRILTWQLVNEPEWEISNAVVELDDLRDLVAKVAISIHENSTALASIGSATLEGLELWQGLGLDYYTAHWYDPMSSGFACAICTSYSEVAVRYGIDAPLVIGEFYGGPDVGVEDRLDSFYQKGYAGAWAWSLMSDRTDDELTIDFDGAGVFAERRRDDVGP